VISRELPTDGGSNGREAGLLFVGDDWAEDHHDVEVQDAAGRRLGKARLPEGVLGIARLHELIGGFAGEDLAPEQVLVGIETDRGSWVVALVAAGYTVYAVNPRQVSRYRERHGMAGAKSDAGDAHVLADMVRTDAHQLRAVAGDSALVEGVKVVARAHQNLIWDRQRQLLRLRSALREYFPPRWRPSTTWPAPMRSSCSARLRTRRARANCPAPASLARCAGRAGTTWRPRPSGSRPRCAPSN
jgi:Transposase